MKHIYTTVLFLTLITFTLPTTASAEGIFGPGNCFLGLMECASSETTIDITTPSGDIPEAFGGPSAGRSAGSGSTVDASQGIAGYLLRFVAFINFAIIPFLFGIALLFFLVNIVRYFIIDTSSFDSREKARRSALYGIAAFVFLVSIWGIVNLFVSGLDVDQEDSICPDYLGSWCGNSSFTGSNRGGGGLTPGINEQVNSCVVRGNDGTMIDCTNPGESGQGVCPSFCGRGPISDNPALVDFGCGSGVAEADCVQYSGLAELLYGSAMDQTQLSFSPGNPRNQGNTPQISSGASCTAGINTLRQAANIETNQAVYAFYTTAAGPTAWTNLTDGNRNGRLVIDADTINQIELDGATDIRIIQMQPKSFATAVELPLNGYGPSTADYSIQCDNLLRDFPLITVDWTGAWKSQNESSLACPRRTSDTDDLALIDALYAVSMLPAGDRNNELQKLLNSDLIPNDHRSDLAGFADGNLNNFSEEQIRNLADGIESDVKLNSNRVSTSEACRLDSVSVDTPTQPPVSPQTAEELVRDAVTTTLGEDPATVSIINVRTTTWPNGCLGLAEAGDICTQALVPGFEIVLNISGEQRVFHTNSDGSIFREDRS